MIRNRYKRILVLLFSALLVFAAFGLSYADTDIAASRRNISANKEKIEALKAEQSQIKGKISELSVLKNDAAKYIEELDRELASLDERIASLETEITKTAESIEETEIRLSEAKEKEKEQYQSMKLRMKYIYEAGGSDFLDSLSGAASFAELLNRVEYVKKVSEYDRSKLSEYEEIMHTIEEEEKSLEVSLELLSGQQAALSEDKAAVSELIEKKSAELRNYEEKISAANAEISALNVDVKKLNQAIAAEESAIKRAEEAARKKEEAAKAAALAKGETYVPKSIGSISFTWPCPSSSRITSYFGDRESPTAGASTNHKGIDIGASSGNNIIAAAGGTVVIATYSQSAGNYVMISHGGGVYTVYMHMKSIAVSEDQEVSKGSVIGYVGSTGYSTGPHLHFGIRVNGNYVNPLTYVSP